MLDSKDILVRTVDNLFRTVDNLFRQVKAKPTKLKVPWQLMWKHQRQMVHLTIHRCPAIVAVLFLKDLQPHGNHTLPGPPAETSLPSCWIQSFQRRECTPVSDLPSSFLEPLDFGIHFSFSWPIRKLSTFRINTFSKYLFIFQFSSNALIGGFIQAATRFLAC